MIYVQLRARVKLAQGETLHVADAAKVLGSEKAGHCSLFCPTAPGVYTLDAIAVAKALKKVFPQEDISLIGAEVCYVHRIKARGKDFLRPVRTAAALLILLLGSALGLTWFHADVNMPQAQADVYAAITGAPPDDVLRRAAEERGIRLAMLSDYYQSPREAPQHVLVVNYTGIDTEKIPTALARLAELWPS